MTKHVHMSPPHLQAKQERPWLFWLFFAVLVLGGALVGFVS
jgi:hypothetical protein